MLGGWSAYSRPITQRLAQNLFETPIRTAEDLVKAYDTETLLDYFIFGDVQRVDYKRLKKLLVRSTRSEDTPTTQTRKINNCTSYSSQKHGRRHTEHKTRGPPGSSCSALTPRSTL